MTDGDALVVARAIPRWFLALPLPRYEVSWGGCWIIPGVRPKANGYVRLYRTSRHGRQIGVTAHRLFYERHIGTLSRKLSIDHLCRNRACVNPKHLQAVDIRTNILRGFCPPARNARSAFCLNGHELPVKRDRRGERRCLICKRQREVRRLNDPKKRAKELARKRLYNMKRKLRLRALAAVVRAQEAKR